MSQYLTDLQRAIEVTEGACPSNDVEYQIGWSELTPDLAYAMSLGETATRQHMFLWNDDLPLENAEEIGYLERVKAIKQIMEGVE